MSQRHLLKNLKISSSSAEINVRILKLQSLEIDRILRSLSSDGNLSFVYKPAFSHSFSVYPQHDLTKEYLRVSLPVHYKPITHQSSVDALRQYFRSSSSHDLAAINDAYSSQPYLVWLLGHGKCCMGYFDETQQLSHWREISRIMQCGKTVKLKYPKKEPLFLTDENLKRFYKESMYKMETFNMFLKKKVPHFSNLSMNEINIAWMADDRIWRQFWELHTHCVKTDNFDQQIMPFEASQSNLIRISDFSMPYPRKSDLLRFSHELREFFAYIDNDLIEDAYFPVDIKGLMSDKELCWDPLEADSTEKRNRKGQRKLLKGLKSTEDGAEIEGENVEETKPWMKKEKLRQEKEDKKQWERRQHRNQREILQYARDSEKMDDLESLLSQTGDYERDQHIARI